MIVFPYRPTPQYMTPKKIRPDHIGVHRTAYAHNKTRILAQSDKCGICGGYVDKTLKAPNPMRPTVDHIIPISKGGHPSDIANLQLAHWRCNRYKSDKMDIQIVRREAQLYQTRDWTRF